MRAGGWIFPKGLSGVCDRRNKGCSREDGRAGADGGDMAPGMEGGGALEKGATPDGREKRDERGSRAGRSVSDPSLEEMDMLLPGRWAGGGPSGSRERKEPDGLSDMLDDGPPRDR